MFKPGQKVICVNSKLEDFPSPLVYGGVYFIKDCVKETCKCGRIVVNVGIIDTDITNNYTHISCRYCGVSAPITNKFWWFLSSRFVPAEDWKQAEYMVEELLQEETIEA